MGRREAGQDNLFDDLGQPLLDNAFGGYNNCIFAYGQTGSGKSYSMVSLLEGRHGMVLMRAIDGIWCRVRCHSKDL